VVTACFRTSETTTKLLLRGLSKTTSETEAGFNTDIVVKELLDLPISKHILNKREVDKLQSTKTHFNEVPEEPDIKILYNILIQ
jgi:DNA polymerase I-like protein with 3'-5' exonuclease and polymerase domains